MDGWITTAQLAERAGVSPQAIGQRVRRGQLTPAGKLPGIRGAYLFQDAPIPASVEALQEGKE